MDPWTTAALTWMAARDQAQKRGSVRAMVSALATYIAVGTTAGARETWLRRAAGMYRQASGQLVSTAAGRRAWEADKPRMQRAATDAVIASVAQVRRMAATRVTDGSPCAFCAMLAGRGPVYKPETARFTPHRGCGCTIAIVPPGHLTPEAEAYQVAWADSGGSLSGLRSHLRQERQTAGALSSVEMEHLGEGVRLGMPGWKAQLSEYEKRLASGD